MWEGKTLRRDARWRTRFGSWVRRFGVRRLTAELGVTDQAVYQWIAGRSTPRFSTAQQLLRISAGEIRIQDIHAHREGRCERD